MKRTKRSVSCLAAAAAMLVFGVVIALSGCVKHDYDFSSTVIHTDRTTERAQTDYAALAGIYKADFMPSGTEVAEDGSEITAAPLVMYLMITEDGSFAFSNKLEFDNAAYGAGSLGLYLDQDPVFIYFALNNTSVTTGSRVSRYEVGEGGVIQFLSPMWFGNRRPEIETESGKVYPTFVPYHERGTETLTMGQDAEEVISSARAEFTYPLTTRAPQTARAATEAPGTTAAEATTQTQKNTTNNRSSYTYKYTPGGVTKSPYTYTMPDGKGKKKPATTTKAAKTTARAVTTTAAPETTTEEVTTETPIEMTTESTTVEETTTDEAAGD